MNDVRVRFAPSPTGFLHIGSARTALFNWLYAKNQNGKFILRIEDTDKERSDNRFLDEILQSLQWLGMGWDDEIYYQSRRYDIYKEAADRLVSEAKAYYEQTEKGKAVRLKVLKDCAIIFYDIIRDKIEVNSNTLDDLVLIKSDGSPTYNFACVVDDAAMGITHVIRGDDHIANTPKQILVYQALGIKPPKFAHIPLILGEDKSRMSKRHGATSIQEYRQKGYFPEAIVNFISLMGWSPKDNREKLSVEQIIRLFSLKSIVKTGAVFNIKKLDWLNGEYIRQKPIPELTDYVQTLLQQRGIIGQDCDRQWLEGVVKSFQTRFCNIDEFIEKSKFLFVDKPAFDPQAKDQYLGSPDQLKRLKLLAQKLDTISDFSPSAVETAVRGLSDELGVKPADIIHPARVALTGASAAPGIFDVICLIGKKKVIERLLSACAVS
ncbi:MAG: glutamate--tRNA ligase [Candidatus Omnitrophica bacterium]|jgi:glutamyl-tRNA synthetase|nr:glutamate--tRNA ligase [Candidatus Omnitrophota bacterium]